jgi:predicted lysophospholipase L1 biosynthesis ABC-type transport system permease subunit
VISPFVRAHLRQNLLHSCVKIFAVTLEVCILLTWVGVRRGIGLNPSIQRLNFGIFVCVLLLFAFAVCSIFLSIGRYSEVLEMTQEIGVLRILGASTGFILNLLYQETMMVTIVGTGAGIAMTFGAQRFVAIVFARYLTLETAYDWWPIVAVISSVGPAVGAALALPRSMKQGVKDALSAEG